MLLAQTLRNPELWIPQLLAEREKQIQPEEGYGSNFDSYQQRRDSAVSLSPPLAYIYNGYQQTSVHNAAFNHDLHHSMSSMDQVIETPELLEQILLFLDQRSLLTSCLRVSKTWQSLINTSPSLQRHLFLRPALPQPAECHTSPTLNPLLSWGFPNWFDGSRYPERVDVRTGIRRKPRDSSIYFDYETYAAETFAALPWARNPQAWRRKTASWRRMEITQQPIRVLHVRAALDTWGERTDLTGTALFPATESNGCGLRMGELYDFVTRRMENFHFSPVPGDWVGAEGRWAGGDEKSTWRCKCMDEPCKVREGNWCMVLHIYQPFYPTRTFGGKFDESTFKSEGAIEPFQVFSGMMAEHYENWI